MCAHVRVCACVWQSHALCYLHGLEGKAACTREAAYSVMQVRTCMCMHVHVRSSVVEYLPSKQSVASSSLA